jgi:hypothetical protein
MSCRKATKNEIWVESYVKEMTASAGGLGGGGKRSSLLKDNNKILQPLR